MSKLPGDLEQSITKTVALPNLPEILAELGEIALDSMIKDEVAKELPFVGSVYKLYRTAVGIRERMYIKKIFKFLSPISNASDKERQEFIAELDRDGGKEKFSDTVLMVLERLDDMDKATIIGRLTKALIEKRIDFGTWQRLCHAVSRTFISDLRLLLNYYENGTTDVEIGENLVANGLMNSRSSGHESSDEIVMDTWGKPIIQIATIYHLNHYGKLLVDIALK